MTNPNLSVKASSIATTAHNATITAANAASAPASGTPTAVSTSATTNSSSEPIISRSFAATLRLLTSYTANAETATAKCHPELVPYYASALALLPKAKKETYASRMRVLFAGFSSTLLLKHEEGRKALTELAAIFSAAYVRELANYYNALALLPHREEEFTLLELHCKPAPVDLFAGTRVVLFKEHGPLVAELKQFLELELDARTDAVLWEVVRGWQNHGLLWDLASYMSRYVLTEELPEAVRE